MAEIKVWTSTVPMRVPNLSPDKNPALMASDLSLGQTIILVEKVLKCA